MKRCCSDKEMVLEMTASEISRYVKDNLEIGKMFSIELPKEADEDEQSGS